MVSAARFFRSFSYAAFFHYPGFRYAPPGGGLG